MNTHESIAAPYALPDARAGLPHRRTHLVHYGHRLIDIQDGILDLTAPDFERRYWTMQQMNAWFRVPGKSWWPEEMPSETEYTEAETNLVRTEWCVDCVLTHCAPTSITKALNPDY